MMLLMKPDQIAKIDVGKRIAVHRHDRLACLNILERSAQCATATKRLIFDEIIDAHAIFRAVAEMLFQHFIAIAAANSYFLETMRAEQAQLKREQGVA